MAKLLDMFKDSGRHPDDDAVDSFASAMKDKLARSREKGRGGWEDPEVCSPTDLAKALVRHIRKGDPVDIANYSMMLFHRPDADFALADMPVDYTINMRLHDLPEFQALMTRLADFLRPTRWIDRAGEPIADGASVAAERKLQVGAKFILEAALTWPEEFEVTKAPCPYQGRTEYQVRKVASGFPPLGQVYQHYKGGRYELLCIAKGEATGQPMVVYRPEGGGQIWTRPLTEWTEKFTLLGDAAHL